LLAIASPRSRRYTALTASLASQLLQKAYSVRTTDQRKTKYRWQAERRGFED